MRLLRLLPLLVLLATCSLIAVAPTYARGGGGGGGGTAVGGQTFRANGGVYLADAPTTLTGTLQYSLDQSGRAKLVVNYTNLSRIPSGSVLDVLADGVTVGTFTTTDRGGSFSLSTAPRLTLQSRITLLWNGATVANGFFTVNL